MSNFVVPSFNAILQQLIADYLSITQQQGYLVTIDPNSETYARLATDAQMATLAYYLFSQGIDQRMVDTATGANLDRLANNRNIYRKGATSASGQIQFLTSTSQTIVAGTQLNGPNSLIYQVAVTGVYSNLQPIPVVSVSTGSNTNLEVGELLNWNSQPFNSQSYAPVYTVITGGSNAESDADLRSRVLSIIQYPPQAGNASQLQNLAGTVDPIVQNAFIYSNYNGAGSLLIVLTGNQTISYIGRDIPHLPLDNYLPGTVLVSGIPSPTTNIEFGLVNDSLTTTPYNQYAYVPAIPAYQTLKNTGPNLSVDTALIYGQLPINLGNTYATAITTVNNIPASLSISMNLPTPNGAVNNSTGSGWLNFNTWPNPDGYKVHNFCQVTAVTSSTQFTVQAASLNVATNVVAPVAGVSKICWVNRSDAQNTGWLINTATITAATDNGNNTWTITISSPFVFPSGQKDFYGNSGLAVGDFIFPASVNSQTYLNQILQSFGALGPGEITTSKGLQALGAIRFPSSAAQYPEVIDARFLTSLITNNSEVIDAEFVNNNGVYNMVNGSAVVGSVVYGQSPPANAPPGVWVPCQIGFYDTNWVNYLSSL